MESNFHRGRAVAEVGALPGRVVEVFCACDAEVAARRYRERAGSRHAGHFDAVRTPGELWNDQVARPVDGGWRGAAGRHQPPAGAGGPLSAGPSPSPPPVPPERTSVMQVLYGLDVYAERGAGHEADRRVEGAGGDERLGGPGLQADPPVAPGGGDGHQVVHDGALRHPARGPRPPCAST